MKSANCISQTGRSPSTAAPTAAPMIALSASGASSTRSAPNSSMKPSVTLKAPPKAPMSSPRQSTVASRRISSRSPSEIASRYVSSRVWRAWRERASATLDDGARRRRAASSRSAKTPSSATAGSGIGEASARCRALVDVGEDLSLERLDLGGLEPLADKTLALAVDRVALRPLLEHLRGT